MASPYSNVSAEKQTEDLVDYLTFVVFAYPLLYRVSLCNTGMACKE